MGGDSMSHCVDKMYLCRVCNKQVVGDDRAVWEHMRAHAMGTSTNFATYHHHETIFKSDNRKSSDKEQHNQDLASSLVLLSNGTLKPFALVIKGSHHPSPEDHKASKEPPLEIPFLEQAMQNDDSGGDDGGDEISNDNTKANDEEVVRGTFECRACNKVFYSHQALGGHRASHKKIKGCFAAAFANPNEKTAETRDTAKSLVSKLPRSSSTTTLIPKKKSKSHECSICHRVFPSGQALGGHKRCHWHPSSTHVPLNNNTSFYISSFHNFLDESQPLLKKPKFISTPISKPLDLNMIPPPPLDHNLAKLPNYMDKVDVGSRLSYTLGTSMTKFLGHKGISTDINIYQSPPYYKSTHNPHSLKGSTGNDHTNNRIMSIQLRGLRDKNNLDGQLSSWLQLGIGSS